LWKEAFAQATRGKRKLPSHRGKGKRLVQNLPAILEQKKSILNATDEGNGDHDPQFRSLAKKRKNAAGPVTGRGGGWKEKKKLGGVVPCLSKGENRRRIAQVFKKGQYTEQFLWIGS